ncbi:hypothetical protein SERLA73DRAFT_80353 [Serpula lacrymans var. lacrymans S7.3]|uniref:Uncharacterized protein n=1 Tax=Serpula lacrymans var. lacrymans (strain S7.3) TaxID=936435 RepID=F8QJI1_SERL3|nr:hypothetical protein SERLA73DRAFT_80353 [Serpula lacrymans var. lacrymans S7.3]
MEDQIITASVVPATPSKAPHSSGAAAINGVKEQMQRVADNKEQCNAKHNDFRYHFLNIIESAFTGSVSDNGSSNVAPSSSSCLVTIPIWPNDNVPLDKEQEVQGKAQNQCLPGNIYLGGHVDHDAEHHCIWLHQQQSPPTL